MSETVTKTNTLTIVGVLNVDASRLQRRFRATLPCKNTRQKTDEQRPEILNLVTGGQSRRTKSSKLQFQLAAEEPV